MFILFVYEACFPLPRQFVAGLIKEPCWGFFVVYKRCVFVRCWISGFIFSIEFPIDFRIFLGGGVLLMIPFPRWCGKLHPSRYCFVSSWLSVMIGNNFVVASWGDHIAAAYFTMGQQIVCFRDCLLVLAPCVSSQWFKNIVTQPYFILDVFSVLVEG